MDEKQPLLVPGPSLNSSYEIEEVSPDETEKPLDYSKLLNKSKFWKLKMFTILWISVFLFCVPLITIINLFPLLILDMLGNQKEEISEATQITGYMLMINAVACFLTAPILGSLSDVYGRKIVWILVNLATIIDVAAMSFSPLIWMLYISKFISGLSGSYAAITATLASDISLPKDRSFAFAVVWSAAGCSIIPSPLIFGWIADTYGIRYSFMLLIPILVFNILFVLIFLPETKNFQPCEEKTKLDTKKLNPFHSCLHIFRNGRFVLLMSICYLFVNISQEGVLGIVSLYFRYRFDFTAEQIGFITGTVTGISFFLGQAVVLPLSVWLMGEKMTFLISLLIDAITGAGYGWITQPWMIYPLVIVRCLGLMVKPTFQAIYGREFKPEFQGEIYGVLNSIQVLGAIIGPNCFNLLFSYFTSSSAPVYYPGMPFIFSGLLVLIAFVFGLFAIFCYKRKNLFRNL